MQSNAEPLPDLTRRTRPENVPRVSSSRTFRCLDPSASHHTRPDIRRLVASRQFQPTAVDRGRDDNAPAPRLLAAADRQEKRCPDGVPMPLVSCSAGPQAENETCRKRLSETGY